MKTNYHRILRSGLPRNNTVALFSANGIGAQHRCFAAAGALKQTLVYDRHASLGGKIVDFAGYGLPVSYPDLSIIDSCKWTRESASVFDVSHMVSIFYTGKDSFEFLESLTPIEFASLGDAQGRLSVMLNPQGGIIDDTLITKLNSNGDVYQVINAGCAEKDLAHITAELSEFKATTGKTDVTMDVHTAENRGLFALQGPKSADVLQRMVEKDLKTVGFGGAFWAKIAGIAEEVLVCRSGYTGEDGFEIFSSDATALWDKISGHEEVRPAGLGARDALRLEAGLCLYGHDIDENTTPIEASLAWVIPKGRRSGVPFIGSDVVLKQLVDKSDTKRRVGLVVQGPVPAREGMDVVDADGNTIGKVTSGRESPISKEKIAIAYVDKPHNKIGTNIQIKIRSKKADAKVVKMPFIPTKYYKP